MKVNLSQLRVGEQGKIYALNTDKADFYRKLLNLGFFPGSEVKVIQTFPTYLIQLGFTQIALDQKTCGLIEVLVTTK